MNEENKAVEGAVPAAGQEAAVPAAQTQEDVDARIAQLEADKAKLIEEGSNYKLAFLKEKDKNRSKGTESEETEEERIDRIVNEKLNLKKVEAIEAEKDAILKKLAKENKELKLAQLNGIKAPPTGMGSHSEAQPVRDGQVTPEQIAAFKARGWSEKDIERYKANLRRYAR